MAFQTTSKIELPPKVYHYTCSSVLFHSSIHSSTRHRQRSPSFDIIIYIIIYLPTAVRFSCCKFFDRQCRRVRARWKMPITILLLIMTENKIENMTTTGRLLHMRHVCAQTRRIRLIIVGGRGGHIIVRGDDEPPILYIVHSLTGSSATSLTPSSSSVFDYSCQF